MGSGGEPLVTRPIGEEESKKIRDVEGKFSSGLSDTAPNVL